MTIHGHVQTTIQTQGGPAAAKKGWLIFVNHLKEPAVSPGS
jgi:hypothetical protein